MVQAPETPWQHGLFMDQGTAFSDINLEYASSKHQFLAIEIDQNPAPVGHIVLDDNFTPSYEESVMFTHFTRGAVTTLSFSRGVVGGEVHVMICFSTIYLNGQPNLASGCSSGVISLWNLEKRRLQSVIRDVHDSLILPLHFFANELVLMSSSTDNSIKMWIFDTSDGDPRLLHFRSGHSSPPKYIK
ncbi:hypothetical protein G4B88_009346 [Cannabis sativa]|uniref:Uncharacterized protein n=1 Tax=Cannabis sativa TaxID=3483 RepID=A0A7J6E5D7_CANSA|nr:hypothetical protein G4B88_009346 [Cannabis sativa]